MKNYLGIREGDYIYAIIKDTAPHIVREENHNTTEMSN